MGPVSAVKQPLAVSTHLGATRTPVHDREPSAPGSNMVTRATNGWAKSAAGLPPVVAYAGTVPARLSPKAETAATTVAARRRSPGMNVRDMDPRFPRDGADCRQSAAVDLP